jgi:hypothetical protein
VVFENQCSSVKRWKKWDLLEENFEKIGILEGGKIRETSIDIPIDLTNWAYPMEMLFSN